jgi:hypothetical protein
MNAKEAELIVHVYGKFLEEYSFVYPAVIPKSKLPYSIKMIEEAFDIFSAHFSGEQLNQLQMAKASLLMVKPDKEAEEINKNISNYLENK